MCVCECEREKESMRRHVGFKSNFAYQYIHKTRAYTPINYTHIHVYYWMFKIYI